MQHTEVDHLVVAAAELDQASAWCEATLGVSPVAGGQHPLMGTHNRLLQLSSAAFPRCYLELIAIDPTAPAPGRPRWFGLDDPALQARLREHGPELVGHVARSGMLDMHRFGLIHCQLQPGPITRASRETPAGRLSWQILIPDDGRPLAQGAVPTLIQWDGPHPSERLPDSGVHLQSMQVRGLRDPVARLLALRGVERATDDGPVLQATLTRPDGRQVTLSSTRPG